MITPFTETSSDAARIPLSVPEFRGNEWRYLKECLDAGWVSSAGPFVERFEEEIARTVGAKQAVAVVNGTAGLHVALQVVGVKPEDEVLVSDLTFVAPVNAVRYCQAHPVLIDADPKNWQMDAAKLEQFLSAECEVREEACFNKRTGRRVRAILPVHILGLACEMDRIVGLAWRFHLKVVEDAAEGIGVRYRGKHVGTFGDVGVFSFNGNKIVTCGGGGMLVSDDNQAARYARYLTTQAKDDDLEYLHNEVGYNYRLTNIQAAVGLAQMERLGEFLARKRAIAEAYRSGFIGLDGITPMPAPESTEPTYWLYTVLLREGTKLTDRQAVIQRLRAQGIGARGLWHPIHSLPPYRQEQAFEIEQADRLYERAVSLPSSVGLTALDLDRCIRSLVEALEKG
ncbi:MAG: LegC family aminotransferase [Candidatus Omnitrophica bacterium]|nr:LegC family aminotransferase [Candidatus Omnitrophota bacterium]